MQRNKKSIRYTIKATLVIMVIEFFDAIAFMFWISLFPVIMLIVKIKMVGGSKLSVHHIN